MDMCDPNSCQERGKLKKKLYNFFKGNDVDLRRSNDYEINYGNLILKNIIYYQFHDNFILQQTFFHNFLRNRLIE